MEYLLNAIWTFIDVVFFHFFWNAFLPSDKAKKRHAITMTALWVCCILNTSFVHVQLMKQILSICMFFVVSVYLYNGHWYQHILITTLGFILNGVMDMLFLYGVSALLKISYSALVWRKMTYIVTVTISRLVSLLVAWMIFRMRDGKQRQSIRGKWILLALAFPVLSILMMIVVFHITQQNQDLSIGVVIFSAFLAAANIAIIYLIGIMEKSMRQTQENVLLHQRMDIQTESIIALEQSYRNQRKATHEYQNQLQTIYTLLLNNDTESAKSFIQQLRGMQTTRIFSINSHHPTVDAILNHKYQYAKECGIDFQMQVNDLSGISIDANSLVVLLSNLLDNAIEACAKLPDNRAIQCRILAEDAIFISIRNSSAPTAIIGDSIPTTKAQKEEHGFGIPHIQLILNRMHAEYTFAYENGWFEFAAEIPVDEE